ncbi:MAG: nucleotidyltransferase [Ruminococcus sp.]|nr:nucleotidyltransferase [Ruminococcus sp.]
MEAVGIICEYNPLHKGHIYHIEETKKLFPGRAIILVLNGYFLERGEVSILSKENKTKLALIYGVDLVVELPFIFGSQSADIFADASLKILNYLHCNYLVFGSECNNISLLEKVADIENTQEYNDKVKEYLSTGINYPTALAKALNISENVFNPNDLLGISYLKAIKKNNYNIKAYTIKRTSNYHDLDENNEIISASNIRNKIKLKEDISLYVPRKTINCLENITSNNFFPLLKYKILTDNDLSKYLTVDEGIENRLKEKIRLVNNIEELIKEVKTKRYTYNKISRMLIHILIGVPKDINKLASIEYIRVLGFNKKGRDYLHNLDNLDISLIPIPNTNTYKFELLAAEVYQLISQNKILEFEKSNKPIFF